MELRQIAGSADITARQETAHGELAGRAGWEDSYAHHPHWHCEKCSSADPLWVVVAMSESRGVDRRNFVHEVGSRTGAVLDIAGTAQALADVVVPRFADSVCVDVLEEVLPGVGPFPGRKAVAAEMCRVACRSVLVGVSVPRTDEAVRYSCMPGSSVLRAVVGGEAVLDVVADEVGVARKGSGWTGGGVLNESAGRSRLIAPIRTQGVTLGAVIFERSARKAAFDEEDVAVAKECAERAAVSLDNARRHTREGEIALALQRSLLPHHLSRQTAMEVASRYLPAAGQRGLGGDWFDVIPMSGARVGLVVGDVIGHDLQATVTMGRLRTAVRTLVDLDLEPDELLAHLDDQVRRLIDEQDDEPGVTVAAGPALGASCLYAVYDPGSRRCTFVRAGHLPPIVVSPDGHVDTVDLPANPPLGLGGFPFEAAEMELAEGSLIVLHTDGLLDSRDHPDTDAATEQLVQVLADCGRAPEETCVAVIDALAPDRPSDDVALLVARTYALTPEQFLELDVDRDPAFVSRARSLIARQLAEWGLENLSFTAELIASELVTNAIRYGAPPIRLRLIKHDALICEVSDGSSTSPHMRRARANEEGGRGLFLVAQLAQKWGTRYTMRGKTIWAEQTFSPSTSGQVLSVLLEDEEDEDIGGSVL